MQLLPVNYSQFIMNYNINKIESSLPELLNMIKSAKTSIKKERAIVKLVEGSKKKKKT